MSRSLSRQAPSCAPLHAVLRLAALLALSALASAGAPAGLCYDCNGNGVEDAVDIALGTSADANRNGVPDECEAPRPLRPASWSPGHPCGETPQKLWFLRTPARPKLIYPPIHPRGYLT